MAGANHRKCCCGTCAYCTVGPVGTTALATITGIVNCGCQQLDGGGFNWLSPTVFNVNTNFCLDKQSDCGYLFSDGTDAHFELSYYENDPTCTVPPTFVVTQGISVVISNPPATTDLLLQIFVGNLLAGQQTVLEATMAGPIDCTAPIVINSTTAASWVAGLCGVAVDGGVNGNWIDATDAEITLTFDGC